MPVDSKDQVIVVVVVVVLVVDIHISQEIMVMPF